MRRELLEVAAALKELLADQAARGMRAEDPDALAPEPDEAAVAAAEEALDAVEAEAPAEDDAPAPEPLLVPAPATVSAWDQVAAAARAARAPEHFDDGVGATGLAAIRADLGDCRRCRLCEGRTNLVFGVGDPEADLMVIGEGPGEQEDLRGEPFVGPAGQMLDRMLENVIGLKRSQVYIANVVKCRPRGNRNPAPDELAVCKPFLFRQVLAVQPRLILVLGSVALEHVLGIKGILRNRGQERDFRGIPAIPTFHPAYLLRKPEDKVLTFQDLKLVRRRYDELGGRR